MLAPREAPANSGNRRAGSPSSARSEAWTKIFSPSVFREPVELECACAVRRACRVTPRFVGCEVQVPKVKATPKPRPRRAAATVWRQGRQDAPRPSRAVVWGALVCKNEVHLEVTRERPL